MSKKPKLLTTLLSGEKRRHHVAAFMTQEADWNQHEPNTGFARMFIAMLVLHVLIIGWIILSDSSTTTKAPPHSPAAQALLTKSKNEITSPPSQSSPSSTSGKTDDGKYETYNVRSGDSLPMIVARFGVDRDELIALNHLDTNVQFSFGTVLKIPNNKVAAPLQISAARPLPLTAVAPPSTSGASDSESVTVGPESASTDLATAASAFVALSSNSDSASGLAPLPDVSSPAVETPAPDSPPAASSVPVVSKSDSVVSTPAPKKPAPKKTVVASSPPRPVPTPSEMKKRPITKADAPPNATGKTTATKPAATGGGTHVMAKGETLYRLSAQYGVSVDSLIKANNIKDPGKLRDGTKLVIPAK